MIKLFSNKTNSPKIMVESKFLYGGISALKTTELTRINYRDLLFVKLTFSYLESSQKINQLFLNILCNNAHRNFNVKVFKCNNADLSDEYIESIGLNLISVGEVIEQTTIYPRGSTITTINNRVVSLDLTSVLKGITDINPSVMVAINFPYITYSEMSIYSPEEFAKNNEICFATYSEITGLNSLFKYNEHDFGKNGKVSINLSTGKPVYSLDVLSNMGKKIPLNFAIYQNLDKENSMDYFEKKVVPNFNFEIYEEDDYYIVEDATGFKNYYQKVEYTTTNKDEIFEKYGIKHTEHLAGGAFLYQSHIDFSYFYLKNEVDRTVIHLYDKLDNHTNFVIDATGIKIMSIDTSLGYKLTYQWNNEKLERITNLDNEEMLIEYNNDGHIKKVSLPSIKMYADFIEEGEVNSTLNVKIFSEHNSANQLINDVKLYFDSDKLTKVEDIITGNYLSLVSGDGDKVMSIGMYNQNGQEKLYLTSYTYNNKFTKVSNIDGQALYYYFDNYGMVKTIMDDYGRTVTYNYDELENGISKKVIGISKIQNNARNLIENHSFEDENIFSSTSITWVKNGSTGTKAETVLDGVFGEKCLKLSSVSSDESSVYQTIIKPKSGNYMLKGFIKHPNVSGLTSTNIKVGIRGTYKQEVESKIITNTFSGYATLDFSNESWYQFKTASVVIPDNAFDITMVVELVVDHKNTEIYLDDLQLTNSSYFTRYNLVENGYMEFYGTNKRPYGWTFENLDEEDKIVYISDENMHCSLLGNNVMRIVPGNVETYSTEIDGTQYDQSEFKIKKMYKTINIKGCAGDKLIFSVFGKGCVSSHIIFRAFIKFIYDNKDEKTLYFDFDKHFDNWQVLTRAVTAEDNFTKVVIGVEYNGGVEVLLDCFQLYKDSFGQYYNYDSKGNIIEVINGDETITRAIYDQNNKVNKIYSSDGICFKYYYDSKDRLSLVQDIKGNTFEISYDNKDRIVSTTLISSDGEEINHSTQYEEIDNPIISRDLNDVDHKITSTNEFNDMLVKSMNYLDSVLLQEYSNGLEKRYIYNEKLELERIYATIDNIVHSNSFTYDSYGNPKKVTSQNGLMYDLTYDTFGQLVSIRCNNNLLVNYQYDPLINGYKKGQIIKKSLGNNGDYYQFEYNDLGQVVKVKINDEEIAEYSYDENGNVYELKDKKNDSSIYFTYDLSGNLIKQRTSDDKVISYRYDNLGNIQKVTYNINSMIRSIDYEYEYETNEYTKEGYFNRLANLFGDELIIGDNSGRGEFGAKYLQSICSYAEEYPLGMKVFSFSDKYDFINYKMDTFNYNRRVINGRAFLKEYWDKQFEYNKTFYMFIKPTNNYAKENLFSFGLIEDLEDNTRNIEIYSHFCVNSNGTLGYYKSNNSIVATSTGKLTLNKWNLVGITLYKNSENVYKAKMILNYTTTNEFTITENVEKLNYLLVAHQWNLISIVNSTTSSGASSVTSSGASSVTSNLTMPFKVCMMSFGAYKYTDKEFKAIYYEGLRWLERQALYCNNSTIYYDEMSYDGFDVITLNGSLESTKGIKPVKVSTIDRSYKLEKARIFKYDEELQKHVFGCYEGIVNLSAENTSSLAYELPITNQGTISLRFKHEELQKQCCQILSLSISNNEHLGIYVDENNKLRVSINNSLVVLTNEKTVNNNQWYHLILRFKNNLLQIYLDGLDNPLYEGNNTINFTNKTLYLGNKASAKYSLNGCIEMFAFKESYISNEQINKIFTEGKTIIVKNQKDSLGRINRNTIIINNNEHIINYQYDKTRVSKQILHNGDEINYTYDSMNNITSKSIIENGVQKQVSYTYDKLGRLLTETLPNGNIIKNIYDENGNIKIKQEIINNEIISQKEYTYDSIIKDKLISISDMDSGNTILQISYDINDQFIPNQMNISGETKPLTWEGRRLVSIGEATYQYNSQGIRIKKIISGEITKFELDKETIISLDKTTSTGNVKLSFVYDANNLLVGINTVEGHYFYVRDITGNIIGLIDKNGSYIVKYTYDVWGKVLEKNIIIECIASINNPFIYKGYYYDEETQLFYCNSRYYSPELCRWISPDSIEYLDPESINGLNLYCYCGNNPVNYKQRPVSLGGSITSSSVSSIKNGGIYSSGSVSSGSVGSSRVNWENGGFQIPIWISSLMSGSDFGASIAPALRTIYQYIRYPGVKDLNKLYGLDFVPGKLNTVCSVIGYGLLGINIGLSAWSNFTNDNLTTKQQWISFGVDTAYTLGTFVIGYGVGALVSLIPGVGVFIAPFVSAGVTWFIDWTNEKWGWLDDVKQWFNDL